MFPTVLLSVIDVTFCSKAVFSGEKEQFFGLQFVFISEGWDPGGNNDCSY